MPVDAGHPHSELTVVSLFLPVTVLENQDKQGMCAAGKGGLGLTEVYLGNPGAPCLVFCLPCFKVVSAPHTSVGTLNTSKF